MLLSGLLWCLGAGVAMATHIRAGEIKVELINCQSMTYRISLIVYTNTLSNTQFGGGRLNWTQGSVVVPKFPNPTIISQTLHIARAIFTQDVTFTQEGTVMITYEEGHRNVGTLNIDNSLDDQNFFVDTQFEVSRSRCNSSPAFLVPPVDEGCQSRVFVHNPGASDPNGDSLSFQLVTPKGNNGGDVKAYVDPNDSKFYTPVGIDFNHANQDKSGPPTFAINPTSGLVTWDAPGAAGIYGIAIKVTEWKMDPVDSTWKFSGYAVRDMQISIQQCANQPPTLTAGSNLCVQAGETVSLNLFGSDPDHDPVIIEVFTDVFDAASPQPVLRPASGVLQSTTAPNDTAHMQFTWKTTCDHVKLQSYTLIFKITDQPSTGASLVNFATATIKVVAPAPAIGTVQVNPVRKNVTINWNAPCGNATGYQVWRRVSPFDYNQSACETGMPKSLHYALLHVTDGATHQYVDSDLSIGAQYCYRIVALFADGSASHLSLDTCLIPKPARAPVITHVSVVKTDPADGSIRVSWRSPYDIDKIQYPGPYQYQVYRSNGMTGALALSKVSTAAVSDTTFLDTAVPTADTAYRYQIVLYVPALSDQPVDTSSLASSVKLLTNADGNSINLSWDARTPWSNNLQDHPRHLIYRNSAGPDAPFALIDSVDVNENEFVYEDTGLYSNEPLDDHKVYYYKVMTRGGYGNPNIREPLENLSQVISNHIKDTIPPCAPVVRLSNRPCNMIECADNYFNVVKWRAVEGGPCQSDIVAFEIYSAPSSDSTFVLLDAHVPDSAYLHRNLKDMAVCYKVVAVDWVGNRSQPSEIACGTNCPMIVMPNVFTPDITEGHNDVFQAFGSDSQHPGFGPHVCTRFVESLSITILDRWGLTVYKSDTDVPDRVFWDGKDHAGREVPSGVYYYNAKAIFKIGDKEREEQTLKGWVQLIR